VLDLERFQGDDWKLQIARQYYQADSGVTQLPVENEPFKVDDAILNWNYFRCDDDHFVDCTAFYHICHYLRTWAYSQVVSPLAQEVTSDDMAAEVWSQSAARHRQNISSPVTNAFFQVNSQRA
jgi:hypothetical protein